MRERIKNVLTDQMMKIYGVNSEGWWTDNESLNEVADAILAASEEED